MDKVYNEAVKKAGWGPSKRERSSHAKALEKAKSGKSNLAKNALKHAARGTLND